MYRGLYSRLIHRVLLRVSVVVALFSVGEKACEGQSGLYIPSAKPIKNMEKALERPPVFCLLLQFDADAGEYREADLDLMDSAYRIAFALENPNYYTMTVESYGDGREELGRARADAVVRYFAMRSHASFPIRYARNAIHCSCHGDSSEVLRYEVPLAVEVYDCATLPEARLKLNKSVELEGTVLVTFRNDPEECVGSARGCYTPSEDSVVRGYYASLFLAKGSLHSVEGTKDTCPTGIEITIDDHLGYRPIVEQYRLIPHAKQLLVQAGYVVIKSNYSRGLDECEEELKDSVFIRIPATPEQVEAKLRFFAKVKTSRGVEYKALPTRKAPGKGELMLQAPLNVSQLDTVYLGKRIQEKELKRYFYEVDSPTEAASFAVGGRYYVAYRVGKRGEMELKKPLKALFRITPEQEEEAPQEEERQGNPEEIID